MEPTPIKPDLFKELCQKILAKGYEKGDGTMDGAQIVNGEWYHPKWGCDSLDHSFDELFHHLVSIEIASRTYYDLAVEFAGKEEVEKRWQAVLKKIEQMPRSG